METDDKKLFTSIKRATILSGIGMGLLLGLIMGLSVSEVVKAIMGVLTALLAVFLGFDKQSYAGMDESEYSKQKQNALFTALRAGWFGLAVVAGILLGMWIRTNEVFTIPVSKSVKQWTDAGYDSAYARKLVAYERFAINPNTGELGQPGEVQRAHQSNLFSVKQANELCGSTDPDQWENSWPVAKQALLELEIPAIKPLVTAIEKNIPENQRFEFLGILNSLICQMGKEKTNFCSLGSDPDAWLANSKVAFVANSLSVYGPEQQKSLFSALSAFVCELEKDEQH